MNQRMTFTSATLYDGVNDKQTGMTVVVDGQDIVAVGRDVSPGATDLHYDLGGRTIMPGMTIGHWHGEFVDIGPPYFDRRGGLFLGTEKPPAILALQAAAALRTALYSGILRVIGASCSANLDAQMRMAIDSGLIEGPHVTPSSRHVVTTGDGEDRGLWWCSPAPVQDGIHRFGHNVFADGPDDLTKAVREEILFGAEVIKIIPTGGHGFPWSHKYRGLNSRELATIVNAAHERDARVRAHVTTKESIMECIEVGVDILDHCDYLDEKCIEAMVKHGTYFVPSQLFATLVSPAAKGATPDLSNQADRAWVNMLEMLPKANAAGVKIVTGDDFGAQGMPHALGEYARELKLYVDAFGIPAEDVIRWTTANGAEMALVGESTGTISVGKKADLLVVDGDPGDDIGLLCNVDNLKMIIQRGHVVKDELRHLAL